MIMAVTLSAAGSRLITRRSCAVPLIVVVVTHGEGESKEKKNEKGRSWLSLFALGGREEGERRVSFLKGAWRGKEGGFALLLPSKSMKNGRSQDDEKNPGIII